MNKKILMIILVLVMALSLSACGGEETVKQDSEKDENISTGIEYEIVEKNEISIGNAKRYAWEVVVEEKVNVEQLKELSREIIEIAKKEKSFNAIVIYFYDYEEYIGTGFTLGKVEYAPEGDWSKAMTVKPGDYEKMDYKYYLREKDWDKQLTKEEVKIFKAWKDLIQEEHEALIDSLDVPDEDKVSEEIANKFNVSKEEVDEIILKQATWVFNDINE